MKWFVRLLKVAYIALIAALPVAAMADYLATAGSGLTFGSIDLAGIKFPTFIGCDPTTAKQCWSISAGGAVKVDNSAVTQPVSNGGTFAVQADLTNTGTNNNVLRIDQRQVGGVNVVTGNGVTGTGSPRVTIASDNTAFSVNLGTISTAATAANQATEISSLATIVTNTGAAIPAGTNAIGNLASQYPGGAVPITASTTGTTGATTATLAASASIKTYICGMSIRANATAAATNNATITGTVTGTLNFTQWTAPLASGLGVTEQIFNPCVPSSAINTGIAVISGAPGTGGVVSVSAWGYQL